jgi:hypothetical protein
MLCRKPTRFLCIKKYLSVRCKDSSNIVFRPVSSCYRAPTKATNGLGRAATEFPEDISATTDKETSTKENTTDSSAQGTLQNAEMPVQQIISVADEESAPVPNVETERVPVEEVAPVPQPSSAPAAESTSVALLTTEVSSPSLSVETDPVDPSATEYSPPSDMPSVLDEATLPVLPLETENPVAPISEEDFNTGINAPPVNGEATPVSAVLEENGTVNTARAPIETMESILETEVFNPPLTELKQDPADPPPVEIIVPIALGVGEEWNASIFAPIIDIRIEPLYDAVSHSNAAGSKKFILGFVTSDDIGYPLMGNSDYQGTINDIRSIGGDIAISFGGPKGMSQ